MTLRRTCLFLAAAAALLTTSLAGGSALAQPARATDSTYADETGDSGTAPDITRVVVSHDSKRLTFRIETPGTAVFSLDFSFFVDIDADQNPATGAPGFLGSDLVLAVRGSERRVRLNRWSGSQWDSGFATSGSFLYAGGATISIDRNEISDPPGFNFRTSIQLDQGSIPAPADKIDFAPSRGTWSYALQTPKAPSAPKKPAAPTIAAFYIDSHPAAPAAGASFKIVGHLVLSNGASVGAASVKCGAKLAGARLPGSGRGGCTFHIPKTGVGKRLAVTVSATYRGKTKTRNVAFTVRRAPPPATPKPKPKPKPKPPPSPPPTTGSQQITTPTGKLAVDGVLITDRFPPGCVPNTPFCDTAVSGYEILIVWLKVVSGDPSAIIGSLRNANISVVASDGSQTKAYSGGLLSGRLFVAFTPRSTSHGFKLIWPGNPPIPLGK